MFKVVGRFLRDQVERKVVHKKNKNESIGNKARKHCRPCNVSIFGDYLKNMNRRFGNCQRILTKLREERRYQRRNGTSSTEHILRNQWIETLGWSGTLAFGWAFSHNFHIFHFRQDFIGRHDINSWLQQPPFCKHLCPRHILKSILISPVSNQPYNIHPVESLIKSETVGVKSNEESLPVFGPKTAQEALEEAVSGLKTTKNDVIGDLENRLGLQCVFKRRYRKAVIHFAAGSALHNSSATFNLAQCYELGLGTSKNFEKAAKFYQIASNMGNAAAIYNLAVFYAHGYGGLQYDEDKAWELLERACELGEPAAKRLLQKNCQPSVAIIEQPLAKKSDPPFVNNTHMITHKSRKVTTSLSSDDGVGSTNDSISYSGESYTDCSSKKEPNTSSSIENRFGQPIIKNEYSSSRSSSERKYSSDDGIQNSFLLVPWNMIRMRMGRNSL